MAGDDIPADQRDDILGRLQAAAGPQVTQAGHKHHRGATACDVVADPPLRAAEIAGCLAKKHRRRMAGARRMVCWGAHMFIAFGFPGLRFRRQVQRRRGHKPHWSTSQPEQNPGNRLPRGLERLLALTGTPVNAACGPGFA